MKIIDFKKKGNVVRFWLGADDCDDYYGDDWDDAPYEHNAGQVYDKFIKDYVDVVFPFDAIVTEPADDWKYGGNTPYCKDSMKERLCPCIIVVGKKAQEFSWDDSFSFWAGSGVKDVKKIFFGDKIDGATPSPDNHMIFMNIE